MYLPYHSPSRINTATVTSQDPNAIYPRPPPNPWALDCTSPKDVDKAQTYGFCLTLKGRGHRYGDEVGDLIAVLVLVGLMGLLVLVVVLGLFGWGWMRRRRKRRLGLRQGEEGGGGRMGIGQRRMMRMKKRRGERMRMAWSEGDILGSGSWRSGRGGGGKEKSEKEEEKEHGVKGDVVFRLRVLGRRRSWDEEMLKIETESDEERKGKNSIYNDLEAQREEKEA